jgi:hypothetical protein
VDWLRYSRPFSTTITKKVPSWSYGSWIYNYLCIQCLSPLTWVRISIRRSELDTTLCDKVCGILLTVMKHICVGLVWQGVAHHSNMHILLHYFAASHGAVFSYWVRVMVFNATFNNISVISWQSVLLVEETGVSRENDQPDASHWQTLSHNVVSSSLRLIEIRTHVSGDRHWMHR